ncbi:MAG: choice-of-anchor D domain-containing protein [Deltaproteobacteria bacterium]|nr:choice-of-anchor D domain-containing protein [Deltaproteobacteria bacterium]
MSASLLVTSRHPRGALFLVSLAAAACDDSGSGLGQLAGKIEVSPLVDFGDVQIGMLLSKELAVKNTGTAAVRILAIDRGAGFNGDDYEFSVADATFALPPNQTQIVTVGFRAFAPMDAPGSATFEITTDAVATPSLEVGLRGRGVPSGLIVRPDPVDFGTVLVGTVRDLDVEIENGLSVSVPVVTRFDGAGAPAISNAGHGHFELLSEYDAASGSVAPGGGPLEPGQSITVSLRYVPDPADSGTEDRGRWLVANCDEPLCDRGIELVGRGSNSAIECNPETIAFGDVNPGSLVTRATRCRNATNETVAVSGWSLGAGTPSEFVARPYAGTPSTLAPGQEFDVEVDFNPSSTSVGRVLEGTLQLRGRNPRANRDLSPTVVGLGGAAGGPDIGVSPTTLTFGRVAIGTTAQRRVVVKNVGYSDLSVTAIEADLEVTGAFAVDRSTFVVPSGSIAVVEVSFSPRAVGSLTSSLVVKSDDADEPEARVALEGEGASLPPCDYTVSPDPMNFGLVQVLHSTTQGLRISNVGTTDCLLQHLEVLPGSSPAFRLVDGAVEELTIVAGDSLRVVVEYIPPVAATDEGVLDFYAPSTVRPNANVALRGVGSTSSLLVSPNELLFGVVGPGCATRDRPISIYNTGSTNTAIVRVALGTGTSTEFELVDVPADVARASGANINPGASLELSVRYRARDLGEDSGTLEIFERSRTEPYVVPLYGEAAEDPINEDLYEQLETPEVDVLFVIDNSGSMSEEQDSLTSNFSAFIQFADAQALDYRIAVISTDVEGDGLFGGACPAALPPMRPVDLSQGACGYFADGSAEGLRDPDWRLVTPDEQPSPLVAFGALGHQGIEGSGTEQGLQAAYQALSPPLSTGWNAGFLRPDAYLALIFVSDECDQSPRSVDFYANFFQSIKGFRNTNLFSASLIGTDAVEDCDGQIGPTVRYPMLVERTGGVFESISTADWSRALQNLGLSVFGYKSRFFLTNQPVAGTVEVWVDGVRVEDRAPSGQVRWTYDRASNSINFAPLAIPEPGTQISIRYSAECL